jgi:hypothetical protein
VALQRDQFAGQDLLRLLPTGFTYRPRQEVRGFALRPEIAQELAELLLQVDRYHQRSDAETQDWPLD